MPTIAGSYRFQITFNIGEGKIKMHLEFLKALNGHGIDFFPPTEPVRQWQVMRETMKSLTFVPLKRAKIRYTKDFMRDEKGRTSWQTPSNTKLRQAGDCEDITIFDYFNGECAPLDMAGVCVGSTAKGMHAALFYASEQGMYYKMKKRSDAPTFALKVKDRLNIDLATDTAMYLKLFKPTYLICNDLMYTVRP